jgi:aminopeptidase YwaD
MRLLPALAPALLLAACAAGKGVPAVAAGPEPRFDGALAKAEVTWLADPARTGRGVGTPGNAQAATWLAGRFQEIGLTPAGTEGFLQPFEAPFRASLKPGNTLTLAGQPVALESGWLPFTFSDDGKVEGELVFAGYGITAPELGYDDYAGLDVKGKIVLVAQDFPREPDPKSPFRDPRHYRFGEWRFKATTARDHGAVALIGLRDDWNHPGSDELARWKGTVSSRAGLLAGRVTLAALAAAGVDAPALAAGIAGDLKPRSRPLGIRASLQVAIDVEKARTPNVVGFRPGEDPGVAGECVVVGAHFDHLGLGGDSSASPEKIGSVHPGADDNASGTAALLAVARAFAAGPPTRRPVLFVAFSGEELGVLGSSWLVKNPPAACAVEKMQLMVNLDMVGRPQGGKMYVHGVDTATGLREQVKALAARPPRIALNVELGGDGYGASDQTAFYAKGVPVLFIFNGAHADYHRPSDTADKIDGASVSEAARLAWRAAREAADLPARLAVVRTPPPKGSGGGERAGSRPSLGTIPDFAERTEPGVLITGVMPGSPAEKAGLKADDVVLGLGGQKVLNLQDLSYALGAHRPGDVVELVYQRAGQAVTVTVTLAERR